ncbi:MAG: hypothetical protein JNG83_05150 [Opitutaceae bacterium]|nr:hypothetical protein [Opitutaceae bacterium]
MRRFALPLALLLLLGAAGFGVAELNEVKKLRETLAGLDQEREALRKRVWELQKLNGDLAARLDRGARTPNGGEDASEPPPAPEAGTTADARTRGRPEGGRLAAALGSPEVQRLMAMQHRAALDGRYAALFRSLNLSPADLEKFKNLLVDKQASVSDVMAAARAEGLDPRTNRDEIRALMQTTQEEIDESIRATLGDAAYAEYKNYEATLPQRAIVDQLAQRLSYSSTPLNDSQSQQLIALLAAANPGKVNAGRTGNVMLQAFAGRGAQVMGGGTTISDSVIAQAQGVLTPQQLSALQSLQQEQQASAQLLQELRNNRGKGGLLPAVSIAPGGN